MALAKAQLFSIADRVVHPRVIAVMALVPADVESGRLRRCTFRRVTVNASAADREGSPATYEAGCLYPSGKSAIPARRPRVRPRHLRRLRRHRHLPPRRGLTEPPAPPTGPKPAPVPSPKPNRRPCRALRPSWRPCPLKAEADARAPAPSQAAAAAPAALPKPRSAPVPHRATAVPTPASRLVDVAPSQAAVKAPAGRRRPGWTASTGQSTPSKAGSQPLFRHSGHKQRTPARRPVSRVLSPPTCRRRRRSSIWVAGCPAPRAADPRAGRRTPPATRRSATRNALLFGLAPGRACPFHPVRPACAGSPVRHCGAGPRLTADGCYPLPCVAELGLSSCRRVAPRGPRPSDRLAGSPSLPAPCPEPTDGRRTNPRCPGTETTVSQAARGATP